MCGAPSGPENCSGRFREFKESSGKCVCDRLSPYDSVKLELAETGAITCFSSKVKGLG